MSGINMITILELHCTCSNMERVENYARIQTNQNRKITFTPYLETLSVDFVNLTRAS